MAKLTRAKRAHVGHSKKNPVPSGKGSFMLPEDGIVAMLEANKDEGVEPHLRRATGTSTKEMIEQFGMWSIELLMMD